MPIRFTHLLRMTHFHFHLLLRSSVAVPNDSHHATQLHPKINERSIISNVFVTNAAIPIYIRWPPVQE